jgi:hypothetical protein
MGLRRKVGIRWVANDGIFYNTAANCTLDAIDDRNANTLRAEVNASDY